MSSLPNAKGAARRKTPKRVAVGEPVTDWLSRITPSTAPVRDKKLLDAGVRRKNGRVEKDIRPETSPSKGKTPAKKMKHLGRGGIRTEKHEFRACHNETCDPGSQRAVMGDGGKGLEIRSVT